MSNFLVMIRITNKATLKYIAIILLFLSILHGLRWAWSEVFLTSNHHPAVNGVLDIRGLDLEKSSSFYLNGEWEFYPQKLISSQNMQSGENQIRNIQVPGEWRGVLNKDSGSSYGYGTYRRSPALVLHWLSTCYVYYFTAAWPICLYSLLLQSSGTYFAVYGSVNAGGWNSIPHYELDNVVWKRHQPQLR